MTQNYNKLFKQAYDDEDLNSFFIMAEQAPNLQEHITGFAQLAIKKNDILALDKIFKLPNVSINREEQLVTLAITEQHPSIIDYLLTRPFTQFEKWQGAALSEAASVGDLHSYHRLINLGCSKPSWYSDFMFSVALEKLDISNYMLTFYKPTQEELNDIIHLTIMHGSLTSLKYLEKLGANIKKDLNGHFKAAVLSRKINIIEHLLSLGANIQHEKQITIIDTIANGDILLLKLLIDNGIKIEKHLHNAMVMASKNGYVDIIKLLHKHGGDLSLALKHTYKNKEALINYSIAMNEKNDILQSIEHVQAQTSKSIQKI